MPSSPRDLIAQFRDAAFQSAQEYESFAKAAAELGEADLLKLLELLVCRAGPDPAHRRRCSVFARVAVERPMPKGLFLPVVDALDKGDALLRETLLGVLPRVNNVAQHALVCARLGSPDPATRRAAARVLTAIGGRTVFEQLAERVRMPDFQGRVEACDVVVETGGHHAIPVLHDVLRVGSAPEKTHAIELLASDRMARDPASALAALGTALQDAQSEVAVAAIAAFGARCTTEEPFFARVAPLVDSASAEVACAAVAAVARFPSDRVLELLGRKIVSGPETVSLAAIDALAILGGDRVLAPVVSALEHRQPAVRQRAAQVLSTLGQEGRIERPRALVCLLRSREPSVQALAAEVVAADGAPAADLWPRVVQLLRQEDWWAREHIGAALAELAGKSLTRPLLALLTDRCEIVRRFALEMLARLSDPFSLGPLLRSASSDPDWWAREKAVEALGQIGDARIIPHLLQLLAREPALQVACLHALAALRATAAVEAVGALVESPDADVRVAAVHYFAAIDAQDWAPRLDPLQHDPEPTVRETCRTLLKRWRTQTEPARAPVAVSAPLDRLLLALSTAEGDDLLLAGGRCAMMKRHGKTSPLSGSPLPAATVEAMLLPLLSPEQRAQLDARREVDFSYEVRAVGLRFRANLFHAMTGLSAVFRIVKGTVPDVETLGLPSVVRSFAEARHGLVLVGGATGSGKSTTLAAIVDHLNATTRRHIISLEDPIEVLHPRKRGLVNQREIGPHASSFAAALRATVREDPDVILVGEMRDLATISFAVSAAETGHLVFGTIHTASADTAVDRLINAFPAGQQDQVRTMLSQSLHAIICQNLLRRADGPGRVLAVEVMLNTDAVANLIRKGKTFQLPSVIATSRAQGMQSMDAELMRLFEERMISAEDAYLKARDKKLFEPLVLGAGAGQNSGAAAGGSAGEARCVKGAGDSDAPAPAARVDLVAGASRRLRGLVPESATAASPRAAPASASHAPRPAASPSPSLRAPRAAHIPRLAHAVGRVSR